eukprot:SAG31_NODE_44263_length_263_cov_0.951220_1_plen_33_part_10
MPRGVRPSQLQQATIQTAVYTAVLFKNIPAGFR